MNKARVFQTGTINSLLQSVYDGDTTIGELKTQGNFGVGTFAGVDGELIAVDNQYFRADASGHLTLENDKLVVPFAVVNNFFADYTFEVTGLNLAGLEKLLYARFLTKNFIYALRIEGEFGSIQLRSEHCQPRLYRKLAETMPSLERRFSEANARGILVGYWFPRYLEQLNVPSFHFHFVDEARRVGGHVLDFHLSQAVVKVQVIKALEVDLIDNDEFIKADLFLDSQAVNQVEHTSK